MSKEYNVHFNVIFSDMLTGIEASSKAEAKEKALEILKYQLTDRIIYLLENDFYFEENVMTTDILEVEKNI